MGTRLRRGALAALAGTVLVGCGSTVPLGDQVVAGDGLGAPGGDRVSVAPQTTDGSARALGGTGSASRSGSAATPGAAPGGAGSTTGGPTASAPVPAGPRAPVEIGVNIPSTQAAAALSGIGYAVDAGDPKGMATAMAAWVNSHGGLAGHPIRLVFHEQALWAAKPEDDQAACSVFTQDHKAIAVVDPTAPSTHLGACLAQRGAVLTGGGTSLFSRKDFSVAKVMWGPYLFAGERLFRQLVIRLDEMGWFDGGQKVGLLYNSEQPYSGFKDLVRRELTARGHAPVEEGSYVGSNAAGSSSTMNSIALKFKAAGVTRVVAVQCCGQVLLMFAPAARNQQFHPAYSITSADVPNTVETLVGADDLENAAGVGFSPAADVAASREPAPNTASRLCTQIFKAAKLQTEQSLARAFGKAYCDGFLFLHEAYRRAGSVALPAFRAAVDGMGSSYVSPVTFATRFGAGRQDGGQQTRDLRYDTACSCFRYGNAAPADVPW